jgi:small subunit ribosomal protein S20
MPITKSAKKALRQSKKRRVRNIKRQNTFKDIIKDIRKLVLQNKKEEALKLLPRAYKAIDKATKAGIIKKNNASRKKSRLTKLVNAKTTAPSQTIPKQS